MEKVLQDNSTTSHQDHPLYKLGWSAGLLAGIKWAVAQLADGQADAEELFREAYKEVSIREEVSKQVSSIDTYLLASSSSSTSSSLDQVGRTNVLLAAGIYPRPAQEIAQLYEHMTPAELRRLVQEHIQQLKTEGYRGAELRRLLVWRLRHRIPESTTRFIHDLPCWEQAKKLLRDRMDQKTWEFYIQPLRSVLSDEGVLVLIAPSRNIRTIIDVNDLWDPIWEAIQEVAPEISDIRIEVEGGEA